MGHRIPSLVAGAVVTAGAVAIGNVIARRRQRDTLGERSFFHDLYTKVLGAAMRFLPERAAADPSSGRTRHDTIRR
jgi:hypothetical protein